MLLLVFSSCRDAGKDGMRWRDVPTRELAGSSDFEFSGEVPSLNPNARPVAPLSQLRAIGDSATFGGPSGLRLVGRHLVVADGRSDLLIVRLADGEVITRFGRRGAGPGEFRDPSWMNAAERDSTGFWIYDYKNLRLSRFELKGDGTVAPREELQLHLEATLESPVWVGADRILANGLFPDHSLALLDASGKALERIAAAPPFTQADVPHPTARLQLNRNFLAVRPADRRVALAYQFASRIDFFASDGSPIGSISGPRRTTPQFEIRDGRFFWGPANEMAYWAAFGTDRYLYALFCGCRKEDNAMPSLLHIFRWNGDFVVEVALDRQVEAFTVSNDDHTLIATYEDPYPQIGIWELPSMLRNAAR
jgi:hypothetical protein